MEDGKGKTYEWKGQLSQSLTVLARNSESNHVRFYQIDEKIERGVQAWTESSYHGYLRLDPDLRLWRTERTKRTNGKDNYLKFKSIGYVSKHMF